MFLELLSFYIPALFLLFSALGIVFAPKMYLSLISFFLLVVFSSLIYFDLNARYLAIFQFILCGICLVLYLFLLLKKIGRINLGLKLVSKPKMIVRMTVIALFVGLGCLLFVEESLNSLFGIFNYVAIKSSDEISFLDNIFPFHLIILLFIVSILVIRVFLISAQAQYNSHIEEYESDD